MDALEKLCKRLIKRGDLCAVAGRPHAVRTLAYTVFACAKPILLRYHWGKLARRRSLN